MRGATRPVAIQGQFVQQLECRQPVLGRPPPAQLWSAFAPAALPPGGCGRSGQQRAPLQATIPTKQAPIPAGICKHLCKETIPVYWRC